MLKDKNSLATRRSLVQINVLSADAVTHQSWWHVPYP